MNRSIAGKVVLCLSIAGFAVSLFVAVAGSSAQAPPKLSEITRLTLLATYQRALLAQAELRAAQATLTSAVAAFNAASDTARKSEHLAEGTTFTVDVNSGEVAVVPPPAKPPEPTDTPKK